jgi:hypothetical protein
VGGILTAAGQLAYVSEFRFDYWHTESEHRYYTVCRGVKQHDGRWGINEGGVMGVYWDGEKWDHVRGPDAYRYDLEEALPIARRLAFEENQHVIEIMENRFPGEFRGRRYDQATGGGQRV